MSQSTVRINIGSDFSEFPLGRFASEGDFSGEKFRKEVLWPALEKYDRVEISLDDVPFGFDSSFLEEVFGGLIRHKLISKKELLKKIFIISKEAPSYEKEIMEYIKTARPGDI